MKIRDLEIDNRIAFYVDYNQDIPFEGIVTELIYNFDGEEKAEIETDEGEYYYINDNDEWERVYE
ncbi:hypothetical protein [Staphylococcus ratti]|uniref:Uncharacterized protein n=1 Tax=Staphylococcus ratti TaxID=2892440 RepID=A0ABY3PBS5_9STAP|nr:hypothetical protein [Staphylococcus ratti]UEX89708.1 hypothetical protein LN051_09075 [Staphylococcus ratti]